MLQIFIKKEKMRVCWSVSTLAEYEVCVTTADTSDAETKENAWIVLEGKKGQSKEFVMENSSKKKRFLRWARDQLRAASSHLPDTPARSKTIQWNKNSCLFFRGSVDKFEFSFKNLGDIAGICLGHTPKDGKKVKGEVYWHVQEVVITEKELGNK